MNYFTYDRDEMVTTLGTDFVEEMEKWLTPVWLTPVTELLYRKKLVCVDRDWCDDGPDCFDYVLVNPQATEQ